MTQVSLEELWGYLLTTPCERNIVEAIFHHTWKPVTSQYQGRYTWDGIRNWHMKERGWSDIGYHVGVGPDNSIWLLRPIEKRGAHCKGRNDHSVGVVLLGNFDVEDPWANGLPTACDVLARCCNHFNFSVEGVGFHRDYSDKTCPGARIHHKEVRRLVDKILRGQDAESVSPDLPSMWAAESWDWAKRQGLVDGTNPRGPVTREMLATVLHRIDGG